MASRPNIVVVMTDDHGQWASTPYGNRDVRSPTLDYLARQGVCATQAFTPTPVCSPARASFFTGRLPSQHGIQDYLLEANLRDVDLMRGEVTLAELLKESGYTTALTGKWHCGRSHVKARGFDYWLSYESNQRPHCGPITFVENETPVTLDSFQTPFITDKALGFLRSRERSSPFFLFVGYVDTHAPFRDHPQRLVDHYLSADLQPLPIEPPDTSRAWARFVPPADPEQRRRDLAQYYAAVSFIDEQVGRLIDELEAQGELENTLLVYVADHGHMNGQHGLYTKGNATVPQNFYEESIRIPLLLHWPACLAKGVRMDAIVDHLDLFQTVLDAAGVEISLREREARRYPGRSFLPVLLGHPTDWRRVQFGEYGNARMVRSERYKLVRHYPPHSGRYPDELYDLLSDPSERHNLVLSTGYEGIFVALDAAIEAHFARFEAPERSAKRILEQPIFNPSEPWRLERPRIDPAH
ncbi:MAG: sulfatase-like hydrolase/transferase [Chloroflexi bacterium]|nr:sulfatase-like hydrolase/transferase [Chloroflexota bacterium]